MKRKRNLKVLAIILVVLCVIIGIEKVVTHHVDSINTTDEVILAIDPDALTSLAISYDEGSLLLSNIDGVWHDGDDEDFPISQDTVAEFLSNFTDVHATFIIEDVSDYSQYGLSSPQCTVTLGSDSGDIIVSIGSYSTMDEQRYISIGDGNVYMLAEDILEIITTDREDFMANDEIPEFDTLTELVVSGNASMDIIYDEEGVYTYTDSYNYYMVSGSSYLALSDSLVSSYLSMFSGLNLTDYVTYTASSDDLSPYGLDNPDYSFTITADADGESITFTLHISQIEEASEDAEDETTVTSYFRLGDSEIVYYISDSYYSTLADISYDSLRPTEVVSLDWSQVTQVSFTLDGSTYDVQISENEIENEDDDTTEIEYVGLIGDETIDIDTLMSTIDALAIDSFDSSASFKTQEFAMTIYLDNDDYPSVSVKAYQYDGDYCVILVDNQTIGLATRSLTVALKEAMTSIVLGL